MGRLIRRLMLLDANRRSRIVRARRRVEHSLPRFDVSFMARIRAPRTRRARLQTWRAGARDSHPTGTNSGTPSGGVP